MGGFMSIYALLFLAVYIWSYYLILRRTGRSKWWALVAIVPAIAFLMNWLANLPQLTLVIIVASVSHVAMIWVFSTVRWPHIDQPAEETPTNRERPEWRPPPRDD
jgi:Na+/melibiose symporter-like transporter